MRRSLVLFSALCLLAVPSGSRADEQTRSAQQSLKEQGFYYGEISGEMDDATKAALKRFQIRNGLEVTGRMDEKTLEALQSGEENEAPPAPSASVPPPPAAPSQPQTRQERPDITTPVPIRPQGQVQPEIAFDYRDLFRRTPYEDAPREVQREVVRRAKVRLARENLYDAEINGEPDSSLVAGLRDYQRAIGAADTGRLDLTTLRAMNLMPGDSGVPFRRSPMRTYRGVIVH